MSSEKSQKAVVMVDRVGTLPAITMTMPVEEVEAEMLEEAAVMAGTAGMTPMTQILNPKTWAKMMKRTP